MKRIEDIKEFEDIDTYYNISSLVEEIFQDRVEAHKHLVSANKEIERLNNIINEIRKWLEEDYKRTINNEVCDYPRYYLDKFDEIVGSDKE